MALVAWTTIGLFVDAYYHSTDPGLESFFTPWHALFYSGFVATAVWIVRMVIGRIEPGTDVWTAAPRGYRAALVGLVVFAAGGVGDGFWHTIFGVETSLDALLSPTHLLLFVGLLLIASAPFRAAWSDPSDRSATSWRTFLAPLFSLTWSTAFVAFMLEYGYLLVKPDLVAIPYSPDSGNGEFAAAYGVFSAILTTVILMAPTLLLLRRWRRIPFGSITLMVAVVTTFIAIGFDADLIGLPAVILGGLVADQLARSEWRRAVAGLTPVTIWSVYFLLVQIVGDGVRWPPEIWGGIIFFSALTGLAIDGLLSAGASTVRLDLKERVDA
ncbi:MAG: hypothetical protein OEO77_04955 [Acidimicrobiia bacterium]|nr:hypothetical protein [Acidimicrobiia bacterium]